MVITPALRGLFGIRLDAASNTVYLDPHLPADWQGAQVKLLHVGDSICNLVYTREGAELKIHAETISGSSVHLKSDRTTPVTSATDTIRFPLPAVEIAIPHDLPALGARTLKLKVLSQSEDAHSATFELEGMGGTSVELQLRQNHPNLQLKAAGAILGSTLANGLAALTVSFVPGSGYQQQTAKLTW